MTTSPRIPEFGIKRENEERRDGACAVVFDPKTNKLAVGTHENRRAYVLFSGGQEPNEDITDCIIREVREESGLYDLLRVEIIGEAITHYYASHKNLNRIAHVTGFFIVLNSTDRVPTEAEPHEQFTLVWKTFDEVIDNLKSKNENHDYDHWLYFLDKARVLAEKP